MDAEALPPAVINPARQPELTLPSNLSFVSPRSQQVCTHSAAPGSTAAASCKCWECAGRHPPHGRCLPTLTANNHGGAAPTAGSCRPRICVGGPNLEEQGSIFLDKQGSGETPRSRSGHVGVLWSLPTTLHTYMHTYMHACINTYIHAYLLYFLTHMYIYIYTYTYKYTYTYA